MAKQPKTFDDDVVEELNDDEEPVIDAEELSAAIQVKAQAPDKPKRNARAVKENKIKTSDYMEKKLTDTEQVDAEYGMNDVIKFLKKECGVEPGPSVNSTVPTGIDLLDAILGGGFCTSLSQVVGMPGAGKSSLAARVLAAGQRKWAGKFLGFYIDSEESMTTDRLAQLGINFPKISPYRENTVERIFQIIEGICAYKDQHPDTLDYPSVIVWDSIANTLTEKALTDDKHQSTLGLKAAMLSFLLPKYVNKLNRYNISLVGVNQLRDKIDIGNMPTASDLRFLPNNEIPGGKSLLYNTVQLIICKQKEILSTTKDSKPYPFDGAKVRVSAIKNKLFSPNIEIELVYSFERGFSNFWTNFELLNKYKRIDTKSGYLNRTFGESTERIRWRDAFDKYNSDIQFKAEWDVATEEVIRTEIIEPNKKSMAEDQTINGW